MPRIFYDDYIEQEWEPVVLKKIEKKEETEDLDDFHLMVINSRNKSNLTQHEFAQKLNMKVNTIEKIELGLEKPNKQLITKMNKILSCKLPYKV